MPKQDDQDDEYLLKCKIAGKSDDFIAAKLGVPLQTIRDRWLRLSTTVASFKANGYSDLCAQLHVLALQYQLVGESLNVINKGIGSPVSPNELRDAIVADPEQTVKNILERFIVIQKFTPVNPAEAMKRHMERQ